MRRLLLLGLLLALAPAMLHAADTKAIITTNASTCTAGVCVQAALNDADTVAALQITGTWTGTITFEGSVDGVNWVALLGMPLNSLTAASSCTAVGAWRFQAAGLKKIRARASASITGAAFATLTTRSGAVGSIQ
jgi:hypothetical protein